MLSAVGSAPLELYQWQLDALESWLRCGRRGVIEAVTGSGKTDVAIAAIVDALDRGRFVLVVVPSRVLMEQWCDRLAEALPGRRIGRLGDTARDDPSECDVLVATRHSAAAHRPVPPSDDGGLIVVDECHGLGGRTLRRALLSPYSERLGLTATLERTDDAVTELLLPFFGGICFRYGFEQAIADGVCARPSVAFVGVPLSVEERAEYVATEQRLVSARQHLRLVRGMPLDPFGEFLAAVAHLAERDAGPDGRAARDYIDAFAKRRQIVAQSSGKYELLGHLAPAIRAANGSLLFTETVRAANHAINRLDPLVSIDLITGSTARRQRREILGDLRYRRLDVVASPRVLDEGVDVPDANLGIVMSASRTRRQMIQRMGRVLRRKPAGVAARFVIMFAKDTLEDPSVRVDRDGFLDEIERIAAATAVFDAERVDDLDRFLQQSGPASIPEPQRVELDDVVRTAMETDDGDLADVIETMATRLGIEGAYAQIRFTRRDTSPQLRAAALTVLGPRLPAGPPVESLYLEPELAELPSVVTPKAQPKRLSTGEVALAIEAHGSEWRMRCTGCGQSSAKVKYRWQVFDQTVACRCD